MSLDKWINSEKKKDDEKSIKKKDQLNDKKIIEKSAKNRESPLLKKFSLNCVNKNCKYQRIVMKRALNEKDVICPRCEGKMKIHEIQ